jgi:hypothetical protein
MSYCNVKLFNETKDSVKLAVFDPETCKFKLNLDLVTIQSLKGSEKFKPSLKSKFADSKITNDWVYFDLDLMRFSSKHLEENLVIASSYIPRLTAQKDIDRWNREPEKFKNELIKLEHRTELREKILSRYPNLESQGIF